MYESLNLALVAITTAAVVIGLIYGAKQLRLIRIQSELTTKVHNENHEWNRRYAAQEALRFYNYSLLSSPLQEEFNYLSIKEPLSLDVIKEKFSKNDNLQADLHQLLNFYEGLARGILQGLFDEQVVKAARKNAMVMAARGFSNYIEDRKNKINPYAWSELTCITSGWLSEDHHIDKRSATGEISH